MCQGGGDVGRGFEEWSGAFVIGLQHGAAPDGLYIARVFRVDTVKL